MVFHLVYHAYVVRQGCPRSILARNTLVRDCSPCDYQSLFLKRSFASSARKHELARRQALREFRSEIESGSVASADLRSGEFLVGQSLAKIGGERILPLDESEQLVCLPFTGARGALLGGVFALLLLAAQHCCASSGIASGRCDMQHGTGFLTVMVYIFCLLSFCPLSWLFYRQGSAWLPTLTHNSR